MRFLDYLRICLPDYWIMNYPYSKQVDDYLLSNMDNVEMICGYTAKIGHKVFWIRNHPYASFSPHGHGIQFRPSRLTLLRLGRKIYKDKKEIRQDLLNDFLKE